MQSSRSWLRFPGLGSLRLRMLAGFGLVIAISLLFAGFASVWLLRDQQAEWAEQRIGRLVPTFSDRVLQMELFGWPYERIRAELVPWAEYFDVRIMLLDRDQRVFLDTDDAQPMLGMTLSAAGRASQVISGAEGMRKSFRSTRARPMGEDLYLFTATSAPPMVPAGVPLGQPEATLVIAVPATDVTSAWARLLPRFAIAGGLAALFAVVVGTLLTGRITRPIAEMTRASEAMAEGDYEQRIDVRGEDEVAALASAFNQMARRVSRSRMATRRLLANVSHELKTPLTSIQGFSQAIAEGVAEDGDEQQRLAAVIHEEADRMQGLVEDLLYLSRIESGELVLTIDEIDIDALVTAGERRFAFQAESANVAIRHELDGGRLRADGRRIEQVVANLLDNAIRFASAGSEVLVRCYRDGDDVVIAVRNEGEPIPPQDLSQVFDRFYQADAARSDGAHSGLGLAIVSELVQAHGGNMSVRSTREAGTMFAARLPRGGPPEGAAGDAFANDATAGTAPTGRTRNAVPET